VSTTRAGVQLVATICVAAVSWRLVEEPIRQGAIGRLWRGRSRRQWRSWLHGGRLAGLVAALAVITTACIGMSQSPSAPIAESSPPTYSPRQSPPNPSPPLDTAVEQRTGMDHITAPRGNEGHRTTECHVLQSGRAHRRLDLRGHGRARRASGSEATPRRAICRRRSAGLPYRHQRRHVGTGDHRS